MTTPDNDRLEQLVAQVMSKGHMVPSEQLSAFREALARMDGKLDAALSLRREFDAHEKAINGELVDIKVRLAKLEGFRGVMVWLAGGSALAAALPLAGYSGRPVLVAVLAIIAVFANLSAVIRLHALSRAV